RLAGNPPAPETVGEQRHDDQHAPVHADPDAANPPQAEALSHNVSPPRVRGVRSPYSSLPASAGTRPRRGRSSPVYGRCRHGADTPPPVSGAEWNCTGLPVTGPAPHA